MSGYQGETPASVHPNQGSAQPKGHTMNKNLIPGILAATPALMNYQPAETVVVIAIDTETNTLACTAGLPMRLDEITEHVLVDVLTQIARGHNKPFQTLIGIWTNDDTQGEQIASRIANEQITICQVKEQQCRELPGGWWTNLDYASAIVTTLAYDGRDLKPPTRAEQAAKWEHNPNRAMQVIEHIGRAWAQDDPDTIETRTEWVNDAWASAISAAGHPDNVAIGHLATICNGPKWARDTMMLRIAKEWPAVKQTLTTTISATPNTHKQAVAATVAMAAYAAGDEMSGKICLRIAKAAPGKDSLTNLLNIAETSGQPMSQTIGAVIEQLTEVEAISAGL